MISIIVAIANNNIIGRDNQMPWHIPQDLKYFKQTTLGHSIIMGRKTFESFPKALPNRRSIVVTRNPNYKAEGAETATSLEDAIQKVKNEENSFIIGGGEIYRQALNLVDKLYITEVDQEPKGDTTFPDYDKNQWEEISREPHEGYAFVVYKRK